MRRAVVAFGLMLASLLVTGSPAAGAERFDQDPVLFVHGIEGSGAQFESQKMRFMSNGYPERWVDAVDYDSTRAVGDMSEVHAQIDDAIAELKRDTGRSKVDVVAHSLGTRVMYDYFTEGSAAAERKASVDRYINVDGQSNYPGLPTLAVWAGRGDGETMEGAANVTLPNQTHVQACTSAEAFVEYYRFLTGSTPARDIVPETGRISIAGRALVFPQNKGLPGGVTLEIWPVDDATGQRSASSPVAQIALGESGDFGPVVVDSGRRYEFVLLKPGLTTLHYYHEPFVRSDYLIRLPYSDAVEALVQRSERHVSGLVIRYKELWGDQAGQNDVLSFNGTNVCNAVICPIEKQVNALFFYDRGADGRTDLSSPDPAFSRLPFITAADIFLPAARPPEGAVSVSLSSRGGGATRTLTFPNFASTTDGSVLQFNDFELGKPPAPPAPVQLPFTARVKGPLLASGPSRTGRRIRLRIRKTGVKQIAHLVLEYRRTGRGASRKYKSLRPRLKPTTKRVWFRKGRTGQTYLFRLRAVGKIGMSTNWDHSRTVYPYDDVGKGRRYSAGWRRVTNKRAWRGGYSQTSRRGATIRYRTKGGGRVYLIGHTGPNGGKAVFGRGANKQVVSFKSKRHRNRRVVAVLNRTPSRVYRLELTVLRGTVAVDGIAVRRRGG